MVSCRACLKTNNKMIPFDELFIKNYNLLTNLNISMKDKLSHFACINCWGTLYNFIYFRMNCITSEAILTGSEMPKSSSLPKIESAIKVKDNYCEQNEEHYGNNNKCVNTWICGENIENKTCQINIPFVPATNVSKKRKQIVKLKKYVRPEASDTFKKESVNMSCGVCEKSYCEKRELILHLEDHKQDKICQICQEVFSDWPEIISHRLLHIPSNQRKCHLCSKNFKSHITLEYHYRKLHNNENVFVKLKCKWCPRSYDTPLQLNKHIANLHSNKLFICDYCSKSFNNKQKLKMHIFAHIGYKTYICNLCGYSCRYNCGLKEHKIRKHSTVKVYCKSCTRVFENQLKHDKHVCMSEPKLCPICGKRINKSTRMARHLETHRSDKPFKCERCPASFKYKTALQVHIDRHNGNRTKRCEFCPAAFYSGTVLLKHRRIHTGERPYVCKICRKSFTGNSNLKVHMKVHGEYLINKRNKPEDVSDQ